MDSNRLSGEVAQLEKDYEHLRDLAGEILATLNVNRKRGTIVAINSQGTQDNTLFDSLIESWNRQLNQLGAKRVIDNAERKEQG